MKSIHSIRVCSRVGICSVLLLMVALGNVYSQGNMVDWSSFNTGFAESRSENLVVKSLIGQAFVGTAQYDNRLVISGFLADTSFRSVLVNVLDVPEIPTSFDLAQNYPNPFNPTTTINFAVSRYSPVTVRLYDLLGREIGTLVDREMAPGKYSVKWDADQFSSGVYFYRMTAGDFSAQKKMLLMR